MNMFGKYVQKCAKNLQYQLKVKINFLQLTQPEAYV